MTVIAWDGKTLAADKQATNNNLKRTVTKIRRVKECLIFSSGDFDSCVQLMDWYERGCDPTNWPAFQGVKDEATNLYFITKHGRVGAYERRSLPFFYEDKFFACGSGRDYAITAMHCGKSAIEAVEIACRFDVSCGMGIDFLTLEG